MAELVGMQPGRSGMALDEEGQPGVLSPLAYEMWVKYEFKTVAYVSTKCPPTPPPWLLREAANLAADGWEQLLTDTTIFTTPQPCQIVTETYIRRRVES